MRRRTVQLGAATWTVAGLSVGLTGLRHVNADARTLVGVASVVLPMAAALAVIALARQQDRVAGALLLASVATPTYFAWFLNVPALIVGLALLLAPGTTLRNSQPQPA